MESIKQPTAVVVNDDPTQLHLAVSVLKKDGFSAVGCSRAEEALELLQSGVKADIIITDLHMPGIDGWRFCRLLRSPEYEPFNNVPILVMSATFAGADAEQITADVGANGFLAIPYKPQDLRHHVRELLSGRKPKAALKVLIVEDNATEASILQHAFEEHGYEVAVAESLSQAQSCLETGQPDIVVVDYHLPDGPGDQLLPKCKEMASPVVSVVITGDPRPELALQFMRMGADAYIRKPLDPEYVVELCAKARRERCMIRVEELLERRTQELRQSEALLRSISETTSAGIIVFQGDRFVYANKAMEMITGYSPEEIIGNRFWSFIHPEYREMVRERGFARQRGEKLPNRYEFKILTKFGEERWIDTAAVLTEWRGAPAVVATIFDITERKRAEEDLKESERRYAELFDNASDIVYVHDLDGNLLAFNRAGEVITGYSREEALTMNVKQIVAPEYLQTVQKMIDAKLRGLPRTTYEVQLVRKDGSRIFVEVSSQVVYQNGQPFAVEGIARDITERKKIEAERDRLIKALEHSADAIVITDADANIQYVNPAFERMTGYSRGEVIGQNPRILKSGKHGPDFYKDMWDTITRGDVWTGRITNRRKDGSLYLERCTISSVRDGSGRIVNYVAVKRDITERVALEERLRQSQKMEAVGQLAGGIAHDFNNILTAISGYSDLLLRNLKDGDPKRTYAEEIKKASARAASLTQQLLAFSRRQVISPKIVNLNHIVKDMARMLERVIGENIDLVTQLSEDLWNVKVDPGQIEQVIMNLSVNAKDAMPGGGKLIIETANVHLDEEYAKTHAPMQPGPYVMLAVTDTGCGMDAETLSHIFEPFFTTKEKGKGTGLGLATVYGIVKQSDGYIWVYSEPGKGTTFKIYFPPVWEELPEEDTSERHVGDLTGRETILLVEDEYSVRQLLKNVLETHGYKVLDAGNGEDALAVADEYEGEIHLLITDVVMPGMGGPALSEKLLQTRPSVKVIYMSGYTNDALLHHGDLKEGTAYLQKPFPLNSLVEKAREVLNGSGESA